MKKSMLQLLAVVEVLMLMGLTSCSDKNVNVTINVFTPASTPHDAQLFIAGNHKSVGDWNPEQVKLEKKNDSLWSITLSLPRAFFFEFKITRGSWSNQAIYAEGEIPPNSFLTLKSDTTITLQPLTWQDMGFKLGGAIVGTVKYHRELHGEGLNYPRDLIIWLPPLYEKDTLRRYPVLYMHDGQNIIDPATSFIGYDWHIDEVADSLIRYRKLKEIIIVGIYNTPDRANEYDDTKLGRAYMKFIVDRIKPLVDSTYRTLPGREYTSVMGSSMGGLISFLMVWNYPTIFSQVGCVSPVFREGLIRTIENYNGPDKNIRVYFDNGGLGLENQLLPGCEKMLQALQKIGFSLGKNLEWFYDRTGEHNERAWARRVWRPLMFMYGK